MGEVKQRSHWAHPAAEETAENEGEADKDKSGPHECNEFFCCQESAGRQERINPEEKIYRVGQLIGAGIVCLDKEKEKQAEAEYLA